MTSAQKAAFQEAAKIADEWAKRPACETEPAVCVKTAAGIAAAIRDRARR